MSKIKWKQAVIKDVCIRHTAFIDTCFFSGTYEILEYNFPEFPEESIAHKKLQHIIPKQIVICSSFKGEGKYPYTQPLDIICRTVVSTVDSAKGQAEVDLNKLIKLFIPMAYICVKECIENEQQIHTMEAASDS